MDRSKIYIYTLIIPVYLLMEKHVRLLVEYNDTLTEIMHYLGNFGNRIVHLRGSFITSLRNEKVLHFSPEINTTTHNDEHTQQQQQHHYVKGNICCVTPYSPFYRIKLNEMSEEMSLDEYNLEDEATASSSSSNRKNIIIIIIPFTERLVSKHMDDLLRHCRYAKYDNAQIVILTESETTCFIDEKTFNSLEQFEMAMKNPSSFKKCQLMQDWINYISELSKKLKSNHYLSTKIVLFEGDFRDIYKHNLERNEGPDFNSMNCIWDVVQLSSSSSSSLLLSVIENKKSTPTTTTTTTTKNIDDDDNNEPILNPNFKLSIGWYSQIRLWKNDSVKLLYNKNNNKNAACVRYFLKSHPPINSSSPTSKEKQLATQQQQPPPPPPPNIPFITSNSMYLGVCVGEKFYKSPHILAEKLYDDVLKMKNNEIINDDFFFSLCRMPEGWIREFILNFFLVISKSNETSLLLHQDKNILMKKLLFVSRMKDSKLCEIDELPIVFKNSNKPEEEINSFFSLFQKCTLYLLHRITKRNEINLLWHKDGNGLLGKLLTVSQIRDCELNEIDQLSNISNRLRFLNKKFGDDNKVVVFQ